MFFCKLLEQKVLICRDEQSQTRCSALSVVFSRTSTFQLLWGSKVSKWTVWESESSSRQIFTPESRRFPAETGGRWFTATCCSLRCVTENIHILKEEEEEEDDEYVDSFWAVWRMEAAVAFSRSVHSVWSSLSLQMSKK